MFRKLSFFSLPILTMLLLFASCNNEGKPVEQDIAVTPEQLGEKTITNIKEILSFADAHQGEMGDSNRLYQPALILEFYRLQDFKPMWSEGSSWRAVKDSLSEFIQRSRLLGLFPADYHADLIKNIQTKFDQDSTGKKASRDAALWGKLDIILTDGLIRMISDIRVGRLPNDSISQRKDSVVSQEQYQAILNEIRQTNTVTASLTALEPKIAGYRAIREALPEFLEKFSDRSYTKVPSYKDNPANHRRALQSRLVESGYLETDTITYDSARLASAVKAFQKDLGIAVDGQVGSGTLRMLNLSDEDRFISVAISLDRYKLLPPEMPERYIWVNIPSYYLQLRLRDSVILSSKIVVGKPVTRTPLLTSAVSDLVTYPQWTIPTSIIAKEIIPAAKRDPGYFKKKGYSLVDKDGNEVDPYTVEWSKYSKGLPYKVVQGSGDDNALGILKFNFPNKYSVYLHDTNQRYLFAQATRSLSHGCVRVQQWKELAYHIVRYDNGGDRPPEEASDLIPSPTEDSMSTWLVRKEKHRIPVKKKLPVYIRYVTVEARDGKLVFFDDIYGEDQLVKQRYFARK